MGQRPASIDAPESEAVATAGLFLNLTSVIAVAVCLANWGASQAVLAAAAGTVAVLAFVASIVCFAKQAQDRAPEAQLAK